MEEGYKLLLAASVSFLVGVILILLILAIAALILWKCGLRLEKNREHSPPRVEGSDGSRAAGPRPPVRLTPETSTADSGTDRHRRTSSARPRIQLLASFRRRSRKAISDPLRNARSGRRKPRCASLENQLDGYWKMSAVAADCFDPSLGPRSASLWTRVSSDGSIEFENDYLLLVPRDRRQLTAHCQSCGQTVGLPDPRQFSQQTGASAPQGTRVNQVQCPANTAVTDRTARSTTTTTTAQVQQEVCLKERVPTASRLCDERRTSAVLCCSTSDGRSTEEDGNRLAAETSSDDLSTYSGFESAIAGSESSGDQRRINIELRPFVGHALTTSTRAFKSARGLRTVPGGQVM